MKQGTLLLQIADLPIQLILSQPADMAFLAQKYADFMPKNSQSARPVAMVRIVPHASQLVGVHGHTFILRAGSLRSQFTHFNDLLRLVLARLLNAHHGCIFHASALVYKGGGYLFIGPEGAGKSTIRRLSGSCVALGDDVGIVRDMGGRFWVYGSPFYQKTHRAYPNKRVPLRAVCSLHQRPYLLLEQLLFADTLSTLLSEVFISETDAENETAAVMSTVAKLAKEISCFSLSFPKTAAFWPLLERGVDNQHTVIRHLARINPKIVPELPDHIVWRRAVGTTAFLDTCLVINEASWKYEFGGQRRVKDIARQLRKSGPQSPHAVRITSLQQEPIINRFRPIIILGHARGYTIIDGNHTAVALSLRGKQPNPTPIDLIIGNLPGKSRRHWI